MRNKDADSKPAAILTKQKQSGEDPSRPLRRVSFYVLSEVPMFTALRARIHARARARA